MSDVFDAFVRATITISVPLIAGLLVALLVKGLKRVSISLNAAAQDRLRRIAEDAVMYVEEWAADRIKRHIPTSSGEKLNNAVTTILDRVPGVSEEEARKIVKATLANLQMGATQFLDDLDDSTKA